MTYKDRIQEGNVPCIMCLGPSTAVLYQVGADGMPHYRVRCDEHAVATPIFTVIPIDVWSPS